LSDDQISDIVGRDRLIDFGPGEMIVSKGEIGGSMYVIIEGSCSVLIDNPSGLSKMLEVARL
jgi:CRP-like cAMP-binding protein